MTIEDKPADIMASNQTTGISVNLSTGEVNAGTVQFRNRIINGDMRIAQRGTSTTTSGKTYLIDRFSTWTSITTGVLTTTQNVLTSSDEPFNKGFLYSNKITVTTAVSSYAWVAPVQPVEGSSIVDLMWGSNNGISISLSFWYRTNATGTHNIGIRSQNTSPVTCYNTSFNVTTSSWRYYTFEVPPPPVGSSWNVTSTGALEVFLGSLYTPANAHGWSTTSFIGVSGSVNWPATLNNFIEFTGVQLEKGSKATPFEFRPYSVELQLCQRYFQKFQISGNGQFSVSGYIGGSATQGNKVLITTLPLIPRMRTVPTGFCYKSGTFGYNATWYTIDFYYNPNGTPASDVSLPATGTVSVNHYGYDSLYDTGFITMLPGASSLPVLANSTFAYARDLKIDFTAEL